MLSSNGALVSFLPGKIIHCQLMGIEGPLPCTHQHFRVDRIQMSPLLMAESLDRPGGEPAGPALALPSFKPEKAFDAGHSGSLVKASNSKLLCLHAPALGI